VPRGRARLHRRGEEAAECAEVSGFVPVFRFVLGFGFFRFVFVFLGFGGVPWFSAFFFFLAGRDWRRGEAEA
jgi:hypothetical protein